MLRDEFVLYTVASVKSVLLSLILQEQVFKVGVPSPDNETVRIKMNRINFEETKSLVMLNLPIRESSPEDYYLIAQAGWIAENKNKLLIAKEVCDFIPFSYQTLEELLLDQILDIQRQFDRKEKKVKLQIDLQKGKVC